MQVIIICCSPEQAPGLAAKVAAHGLRICSIMNERSVAELGGTPYEAFTDLERFTNMARAKLVESFYAPDESYKESLLRQQLAKFEGYGLNVEEAMKWPIFDTEQVLGKIVAADLMPLSVRAEKLIDVPVTKKPRFSGYVGKPRNRRYPLAKSK